MELSDASLRKGAMGKLAHAIKIGQELRAEMDTWWGQDPTKLSLDLKEDGKTVEFVVHTVPMYPADDWYHRAADIMQNYRNALNRLTNSISYLHTAPAKLRNTDFPIRDDKKGWEGWAKQHSMLPEPLRERFHAFQPYVSGRPYLSALARSNNIEKHEDGFSFAVTLTELKLGPRDFTIEGLWDDDKLSDKLQFSGGETPDIVSERQVIATMVMPTRVIDLGALDVKSEFAFTPMMRFEGEEIPLLAAIDLIGREVAWAIGHITGLIDSATQPPDHFNL